VFLELRARVKKLAHVSCPGSGKGLYQGAWAPECDPADLQRFRCQVRHLRWPRTGMRKGKGFSAPRNNQDEHLDKMMLTLLLRSTMHCRLEDSLNQSSSTTTPRTSTSARRRPSHSETRYKAEAEIPLFLCLKLPLVLQWFLLLTLSDATNSYSISSRRSRRRRESSAGRLSSTSWTGSRTRTALTSAVAHSGKRPTSPRTTSSLERSSQPSESVSRCRVTHGPTRPQLLFS
jgi:hypothetical protein